MFEHQQGSPPLPADSEAYSSRVIVPAASGQRGQRSRKARCRSTNAIALIDEFPLRRASTLNMLRGRTGRVIRPFGSADELLTNYSGKMDPPCCIIMSIGSQSLERDPLLTELQLIAKGLPTTPTIILSDQEDADEVVSAFRQGARGYVPTTLEPGIVIEAIRMVVAGGAYVPVGSLVRRHRLHAPDVEALPAAEQAAGPQETWPPRQLAVLRLLTQGKSNKDIALTLSMEESTVKVHVRHIMRKLGVTNRTEAALSARRLEGQ